MILPSLSHLNGDGQSILNAPAESRMASEASLFTKLRRERLISMVEGSRENTRWPGGLSHAHVVR